MTEAVAPARHTAASAARTRTLIGTAVLWIAACALLVAPTFAAFRSGGYGLKSQLILGAVALVLLATVATLAPWPPITRGLPLAAIGALIGYAVWTGLSTGWARILDTAVHDTDRVGMYCAAFGLALAVMRVPDIRRVAPVVLFVGVVLVCLYALAGRLLPNLVHEHVNSARLSQPLTYWNALGIFAGFGTLLGVALAGDDSRPVPWRAAACAAAVPCGLAAFLTVSRGAAAAILCGLVVCIMLRRSRSTVLPTFCVLGAVGAVSVTLIGFPDVLSQHAGKTDQAAEGAWFLPIAVMGTLAAGLLFARICRSPVWEADLALPPRLRAAIAAAAVPVVLGGAVAIVGHGKETTSVPLTASRLVRAETNRGHYWRVALEAFGRHPVNGVGSGSFAAEWARHRGQDQRALDAHSIYIETLSELGVVGAVLLLAFVAAVTAGVVRAARAVPRDPIVGAAAAVLAAFAVHAGLDWDWEMPAVSLVALIFAAAVLQPARGRSTASR
jgi:O-Antigen ligase